MGNICSKKEVEPVVNEDEEEEAGIDGGEIIGELPQITKIVPDDGNYIII